jgi:hypothetical protein
MPRSRDAFDVRLTPTQKEDFINEIVDELQDAISARSEMNAMSEYAMELYEQRPTRATSSMPWPDAADLTSYLATEKVDALHARMLRTVFTEPVCTVEAWGEAAARAPLVEEFHQWKMEEERLQASVDRALLLSLIDPIAIHEVVEGSETRVVRDRVIAKLALDPVTGAPMLDAQGQPVLQHDEDGGVVTSETDDPGTASIVLDRSEPIRTGPVHKIIPFRDFYMLPGHARDRSEVWCYAKRFYRRLPELQQRVKHGIYDADAVSRLTEAGEHAEDASDQRGGVTVTNNTRGSGRSAEKQLWEFLVLWDFDEADGERWYLATVHMESRQLLRMQHDDLGAKRYVLYVPIPKPDSIYGYSLITDKLITVIEEHTAWRNMNTDKASMAVSAPVTRLTTALWNPREQPLGPKTVIDVRSHDEIRQVAFSDLPRGALDRERDVLNAAERLAGINDTATGQTSRPGTTLGEVQLVAQQSFVRMDTIVHRIQESIEDLYQIRHQIWQRVLAEQDKGADLPSKQLTGLEHRGVQIPEGGITAQTLAGSFRFKPRGSVESADLTRKRTDLVQMFQFMAQLAQFSPELQKRLQDPQFIDAILEEMIRVFDFENRQSLVGASQRTQAPDAQAQDPAALIQQLLGGGAQMPLSGGAPDIQ